MVRVFDNATRFLELVDLRTCSPVTQLNWRHLVGGDSLNLNVREFCEVQDWLAGGNWGISLIIGGPCGHREFTRNLTRSWSHVPPVALFERPFLSYCCSCLVIIGQKAQKPWLRTETAIRLVQILQQDLGNGA